MQQGRQSGKPQVCGEEARTCEPTAQWDSRSQQVGTHEETSKNPDASSALHP